MATNFSKLSKIQQLLSQWSTTGILLSDGTRNEQIFTLKELNKRFSRRSCQQPNLSCSCCCMSVNLNRYDARNSYIPPGKLLGWVGDLGVNRRWPWLQFLQPHRTTGNAYITTRSVWWSQVTECPAPLRLPTSPTPKNVQPTH